jgi:tetratricopeptide (TPR) repeat protein
MFLRARYPEAVALLRETLATCRATYGDTHPQTLLAMQALASSLRDPSQFGEAEGLAREAHRLKRGLYGDERPETRSSAMALAVFLERKGEFAEAESWARRALRTGSERDERSLDTALVLRTLGSLRLAQGDAGGAEVLLRRSLGLLRELSPERRHADEGDVLNRLARLLVERRAADAATLYAEATAFERARGPGPYFVTDGYEHLARAARERGDLALAAILYRRAAALYADQLPERHPYRLEAEAGLAGLPGAAGAE